MNGTTLTENLPDSSEKKKNSYPATRKSNRLTAKEWQAKYEFHLKLTRKPRYIWRAIWVMEKFFAKFPDKKYLEDFTYDDVKCIRGVTFWRTLLIGLWRFAAGQSEVTLRNIWRKNGQKLGTGLLSDERICQLKAAPQLLIDKLIISLALTAGYQTWELSILKWEDIDYEHDIIAIHSRPLDPETKQLLQLRQELYAGEYVIGLRKNVIQQRLKRLCERNGLPKTTIYQLHKHYEHRLLPPLIKVRTTGEVSA